MLAYLGTGRCLESYLASNITWVITGVNSNACNGVIWARLTDEEADGLVPTLVERFRMQQVPAIWRLEDGGRPADLGARLAQLGCQALPPTVYMAAPCSVISRDLKSIAGLSIERVTNELDLAAWISVWTHDEAEPRSPREELYVNLGLNRSQPLRHYLARLHGRPVGVSQLFLGRRAAGVYSVTVLPEYRRLGIGTALAQLPLIEARTLGYDLAVSGPTPDSEAMCLNLGFERFVEPFPCYSLWP